LKHAYPETECTQKGMSMLPKIKQQIIDVIFEKSLPEINEHTMKLIVGLIAFLLAGLTNYFAEEPLQSISESYHAGGWSRDIFVGFLFAISAFLLSYNGKPPLRNQEILTPIDQLLLSQSFQKLLSKFAAFSAIGVAMFPCECGGHIEIIPNVHGLSAFFLFMILSIFCFVFYKRAIFKNHWQAKTRAYIYAICGVVIIACILIIGIHNFVSDKESISNSRLTFWGEFFALCAFGTSWFIASQKIFLKSDHK